MYNMGHLPPNFFPTAIPCQETRFKKQESGDQMNFRLPCDRGGEGICERKSRGVFLLSPTLFCGDHGFPDILYFIYPST